MEIPTEISSGIHSLNSSYSEIVKGKYKEQTNKAISELGAVPIDYKAFEVDGYKKNIFGLIPVAFSVMMRKKSKFSVIPGIIACSYTLAKANMQQSQNKIESRPPSSKLKQSKKIIY